MVDLAHELYGYLHEDWELDMEVVEVNFSKGLNAVTDRKLVADGFSALCDNVDLRSGSARAFRIPEFYSTVPTPTSRIWSFRGQWYYSANYRKYAAEFIGGNTRVYFSDAGPNTNLLPPQKIVNSVQANLGTIVPRTSPAIKVASSTTPARVTLTGLITGGQLQAGTYSYRIAAKVNGQVLQASQEVSVSLVLPTSTSTVTYTNLSGSISLSWSPVPNATSYVVFGRVSGKEQTLANVNTTSYQDIGSASPAGNYASNYDNVLPYSYLYTYLRNVGGMQDEGGPSSISVVETTGAGRQISINQNADGYFDNGFNGIPATVTPIPPIQLLCPPFKKGTRTILTLATTPTPYWQTGMGIVLSSTSTIGGTIFPTLGSVPNNVQLTFPTALANPTTPTVNINSGTTSNFTGSSRQWGIVAMRGNIPVAASSIMAGATTLMSALTIPYSPTNTQSVGLNWPSVLDADRYIVIRINVGLAYIAGITSANSFTDYGNFYNSYSTVVPLPGSNTTATNAITLLNELLPSIWGQIQTPYVFLSQSVISANLPVPIPNINNVLAGSQNFNNGIDVYASGATANGIGNKNYFNGNWAALPKVISSSNPIVNGYSYTILTTGTTNFVTVGASANAVGTTFVATATSFSGTGTCYYNPPVNLVQAGNIVSGQTYCIAAVGTTDFTTLGASSNTIGLYFVSSNNGYVSTGSAYQCVSQSFMANVFSINADTFTMQYQNLNNYIVGWNLYRAGDTGGSYSLVDTIPISQTVYIDTVGVAGLGPTIGTSYTDAEGNAITYAPPPPSASNPTLYKSMLFMINGNSVIWTPVSTPDAFPPTYSVPFPFQPLWLEAYADALCVFCADKIYRLDGFDAGGMTRTETKAEGCIAPYSIQVTNNICLYLSKRGLMAFDGHQSQPLTESTIPYKMFLTPSSSYPLSPQGFWWRTTDNEAQTGELLWASGNQISALDYNGQYTARDNVQDGTIYSIRSFLWLNKYFLYYASSSTNSDFAASTCWCVDLGSPGMPVTTLGVKPQDVHVNETGDCFILVLNNDAPPSTGLPTNTEIFINAQSQFDSFPVYGALSFGSSVMRFNPLQAKKVPIRMRAPENAGGMPHKRKRWREFRCFGEGSGTVRIYIDGTLVTFANGSTTASIDTADTPNMVRRVLLPPGTWGYSMAHEIIGPIDIRAIEYGFDLMPGRSYD